MSYDPVKQYRCDIVRTRAKKIVDDLLPAYARIINDLCPCDKEDFKRGFNSELRVYLNSLGLPVEEKALNNHRTETANTLFGMYYIDKSGFARASERTEKYLRDGDQPAFFKDFCYKLQFPNGMTIYKTLKERIVKGISIYPYRFLVKVLQNAQIEGITLTIREIGYYVLNSLDVLIGNATPNEVIRLIKKHKSAGIKNDINTGKNRPWDWEHIEGLINYLELANLININGTKRDGHERIVVLNNAEAAAIKLFVDTYNNPLAFDISKYPLNTTVERKKFQHDWDIYNASNSDKCSLFETSIMALGITPIATPSGGVAGATAYTTLIGRTGEDYIFQYELKRLTSINAAYSTMVENVSNTRGLGYDIKSIFGDGSTPTKQKLIEVKTTRRVTEPNPIIHNDSVILTKNEWKAARDNPDAYFVFRVYLIKGKVIVFVIGNLLAKEHGGEITITAPAYEMKFDIARTSVVDSKLTL